MRLLFFLFLGLILSSCRSDKPDFVSGEMTNRVIEEGKVIRLDGQWQFYWNQLYTPRDFQDIEKLDKPLNVLVPQSWTAYNLNGNPLPVKGVATYRMIVGLENPPERLAFLIPKIWSSSKVWVNGALVSKRGEISQNPAEYKNVILENTVEVPGSMYMDIVVQVANNDLFLSGLIEPLEMGIPATVHNTQNQRSAVSILWMGALLIMGIYHFVLFLFRSKNPMALYFGIICVLVLSRLLVFGNHAIYIALKTQPSMLDFNWQSTLYYAATFLLIPTGLRYLRQLYPEENHKGISKVLESLTYLYCAFILLTPVDVFGATIVPFQSMIVLAILYMAWVIFRAALRKRNESYLQAAGISAMIISGINDGLHSVGVVSNGFTETIPWVFALFLFIQIIIIAKRFSDAFAETEELSINLEKKVVERTREVVEQKEEIQKQNEDIHASINYAQRIQEAMLPPLSAVRQLFPDSFVLLQPRDTVSGDFYFTAEAFVDGSWFKVITAVDCTGHGVPGAFMSMIGSTILQKIIFDKKEVAPAQILRELDKEIRASLKQHITHNQDGMDMAVCTIDCNRKVLHYSGAMNPLVFFKEGKMQIIKAERANIGGEVARTNGQFAQHSIDIDAPISFYIFSDGFQDQMGGPRGKKFKFKQMQQMFEEHQHLPMEEQHKVMDRVLVDWMGESEMQIDDILLMGVRLNPQQL